MEDIATRKIGRQLTRLCPLALVGRDIDLRLFLVGIQFVQNFLCVQQLGFIEKLKLGLSGFFSELMAKYL